MLAAAVICAAVSLSIAAYSLYSQETHVPAESDARNLFQVIVTLQIVVLLIGGGVYCLQSVHREKDLNTFDYQRITRLTPFDLSVGKLFGAPVMTYFLLLCLMPVGFWAAIVARIPVLILLRVYVLIILGSIAFHAFALLISLLLERGTSAGGILFYLLFVGVTSIDFGQVGGTFALHQLNPFYVYKIIPSRDEGLSEAISVISQLERQPDSFFGVQVSHSVVLVVLYATLIGWFLLAAVRNLKRDPSIYEVYSPVQGFGFVLYLNLLLLGFFRWMIPQFRFDRFQGQGSLGPFIEYKPISPTTAEATFLAVSLWFFAILGLATLRNRDRVRRRIREFGEHAAGWWSAAWPAPYLFAGAFLTGAAIVEMIRLRLGPQYEWNPGLGLLESAFFTIWIARDLLYLQWMNLRRARRPLLTGVLYLIVFYICASTIFVPLRWYGPKGAPYAAIFTPFHAFQLDSETWMARGNVWITALVLLFLETFLFAWLQRRELQKLLADAPHVLAPRDMQVATTKPLA
jgi:hypothetical protein